PEAKDRGRSVGRAAPRHRSRRLQARRRGGRRAGRVTLEADVARLAQIRPFSLMPREAVQLIAFSCVRRRLRAGESLFAAGEEGDGGYFVLSGAILLEDRGSSPPSVRRATRGALIGEGALYAPVARRLEARAEEDSVVIRIPRETFRRVL